MKMSMFTIALAGVILTSCSKNETLMEENLVAAASAETQVSEWESGYTWTRSDSADFIVFSHQKSMPELTSAFLQSGELIVALKNVPYKEDSLWTEPRLVPFSVIPYYGHDHSGRPAYDQHWYIIPRAGQVTLKYRSNRHIFSGEPVIAPDGRVAARYFLLKDEDLRRIGHTRSSVHALTYRELVTLLGVSE